MGIEMKSINIIAGNNGLGLDRDIEVLATALQAAGFTVAVKGILKATGGRLRKLPYDVNLLLEHISPVVLPFARINCLLPNPEWFRDECQPHLGAIDWVLCKTRHAQTIFQGLGCKTEFLSFSSLDRFDARQPKNYNAFFHLAGSSLQKGTQTVIDVWLCHPEWPPLVIIQNQRNRPTVKYVPAQNIEYMDNYLDEARLCQYQNSSGIHLCPSETEGFGHSLVEAMSCKAVIITTDAPPMNEIVTAERGLLAEFRGTQPQRLGVNYYVDPASLEQRVTEVLGMSQTAKQHLGERAREWYRENDRFFKRRLAEVMGGL
jgi:hypothetical protein